MVRWHARRRDRGAMRTRGNRDVGLGIDEAEEYVWTTVTAPRRPRHDGDRAACRPSRRAGRECHRRPRRCPVRPGRPAGDRAFRGPSGPHVGSLHAALGRDGLPSVGSPKVLALLITFSDYPSTATTAEVAARLFGDGIATHYPYDSLRNWSRRSSHGKLDIQGSVLGWYDAGQTRSSVTDVRDVVLRALQYYDPTTDFSQFDNNGDGRIDYFLVFWTGPNNGFWYPWADDYWVTHPPPLVLDGERLGFYSFQGLYADWQGVHVPVHETGHALGLPTSATYTGTTRSRVEPAASTRCPPLATSAGSSSRCRGGSPRRCAPAGRSGTRSRHPARPPTRSW